jgi:hypothetical protein
MKRACAVVAALCIALAAHTASADRDRDARDDDERGRPLTLAVFGDWPYGPDLFRDAKLLLDSINNDPKVSLVLHVGDIHSGSQPCTGVGLSPTPAKAAPGYNQSVFDIFQQLKDPLVYTPGDNEWTDCHKTKQFSSGAPLNELAAVRALFFPRPGLTIGGRAKPVFSQALVHDPAHRSDATFVENVMWKESEVVFVTLNVPGSNNDGLPWTAPFTDEAARKREVAERNLANLRWLETAFAWAGRTHAKGVLIGLQADMWDPAAPVPGGDGLDGYTELVKTLADLAAYFGRPVLLINGDSHLFEVDHPIADPTSATGVVHGTQAVPNLTRITVQGSTNAPSEWLRLTVDPRAPDVCSGEHGVYRP